MPNLRGFAAVALVFPGSYLVFWIRGETKASANLFAAVAGAAPIIRYRLHPQGLEVIGPRSYFLYTWTAIDCVEVKNDALWCARGLATLAVVVREAFPDQAHFQAFADRAKRLRESAARASSPVAP